jgi:hypothetical protein
VVAQLEALGEVPRRFKERSIPFKTVLSFGNNEIVICRPGLWAESRLKPAAPIVFLDRFRLSGVNETGDRTGVRIWLGRVGETGARARNERESAWELNDNDIRVVPARLGLEAGSPGGFGLA